jgi:hypothetical protein
MRLARFSSNVGFPMLLFRFSFRIQIVLLAFLAVPVSHAFAQRVDMSIGDEPGVIPNAAARLVNGDVIDLYDRIPVGTKVIVRQKPEL